MGGGGGGGRGGDGPPALSLPARGGGVGGRPIESYTLWCSGLEALLAAESAGEGSEELEAEADIW